MLDERRCAMLTPLRPMVAMVVAVVACLGCSGPEAGKSASAAGTPSLKGMKVLIVAAPKNFRDEEVLVPRRWLGDCGADVEVVSTVAGEIVGMKGTRLTVKKTLKDVDAASYDAVLFAGGAGARALWNDPTCHQAARKAYEAGSVVGAICIAPVILAKAGLLTGKKATVFPGFEGALRKAGAVPVKGHVVVSGGRIVTADGPSAALEYAKTVGSLLVSKRGKNKGKE